jgi:hypothetical protein
VPETSTPDQPLSVPELLFELAPALGRGPDLVAAAAELVALCGGRRDILEETRDRYARRLHGHSDDWDATAALSVLNRALATFGWTDHYGWKGRRRP